MNDDANFDPPPTQAMLLLRQTKRFKPSDTPRISGDDKENVSHKNNPYFLTRSHSAVPRVSIPDKFGIYTVTRS